MLVELAAVAGVLVELAAVAGVLAELAAVAGVLVELAAVTCVLAGLAAVAGVLAELAAVGGVLAELVAVAAVEGCWPSWRQWRLARAWPWQALQQRSRRATQGLGTCYNWESEASRSQDCQEPRQWASCTLPTGSASAAAARARYTPPTSWLGYKQGPRHTAGMPRASASASEAPLRYPTNWRPLRAAVRLAKGRLYGAHQLTKRTLHGASGLEAMRSPEFGA